MTTIESIIELERKLAVRRTIVLMVTLWMTYRAFGWAAAYASSLTVPDPGAALIIAAVTAPVTYLQKVVFEAYIAAKVTSE